MCTARFINKGLFILKLGNYNGIHANNIRLS